MSPWGPSALHGLGFVAHQASLTGSTSFSGATTKTQTLGDQLVAIMSPAIREELEPAEQKIYDAIDPKHSWLLSPVQKALLQRFMEKK